MPDRVRADPTRLRQIILNLLSNAVKFTPQGEVVVLVRCEGRDEGGMTVHFTVRDTGIGIPSDKRENIFEAFSQGDNSTTRRFGGTGLGLAISSRLVPMMGGRIWVKSEVGQGSEFHFTCRFMAAEPGAGSEGAVQAVRASAPARAAKGSNRRRCLSAFFWRKTMP